MCLKNTRFNFRQQGVCGKAKAIKEPRFSVLSHTEFTIYLQMFNCLLGKQGFEGRGEEIMKIKLNSFFLSPYHSKQLCRMAVLSRE